MTSSERGSNKTLAAQGFTRYIYFPVRTSHILIWLLMVMELFWWARLPLWLFAARELIVKRQSPPPPPAAITSCLPDWLVKADGYIFNRNNYSASYNVQHFTFKLHLYTPLILMSCLHSDTFQLEAELKTPQGARHTDGDSSRASPRCLTYGWRLGSGRV